jgi:hypothetical protein
VLAGRHEHAHPAVDVDALGATLFRVVAPPPEDRVVHNPARRNRLARAPPAWAILRIDMHVGSARVGHQHEGVVRGEAHAVGIRHAGQDAGRLGVQIELRRVLEQQHAVGAVVADGDPAVVPIDGHPVRDLQPLAEQDLVALDNEGIARHQDMPGNVVRVVVADEQLVALPVHPGHGHRARRMQPLVAPHRFQRGHHAVSVAGPARGQLQHAHAAAAIGDDERLLIDERDAVRLTQAGGRQFHPIGEAHPGAHRGRGNLDVEEQDPVAGESGHREPTTAGRQFQVFGATQAGEHLPHFRRSREFKTHGRAR